MDEQGFRRAEAHHALRTVEGELLPPFGRHGGVGQVADGAVREFHRDGRIHVDQRAFRVDERVDGLRFQARRPQQDVINVAARVHEVSAAGQLRIGAPRSAGTEDPQAVLGDDDVNEAHVADDAVADHLPGLYEFALPVALVSDREHLACPFGVFDEITGVAGRRRHGFFHEDVQTRFQAGADLVRMARVGRGDDDPVQFLRVDHRLERRVVVQSLYGRPECLFQPVHRDRIGIEQRHDPDVFTGGQQPGVVAAHAARARNADTECFHVAQSSR